MISVSSMVMLTFFTFIFAESGSTTVAPQGSGNPKDKSNNCCIIPVCDNDEQCYETFSCGYICSHGRFRPANNYGVTPGYKLKEYYLKQDCHFGECRMYKFLCSHCQNPKEDNFSIYLVRDDCKSCYEYSL